MPATDPLFDLNVPLEHLGLGAAFATTASLPDGVVSVIGGHKIIKSCRHYYPAFNGNIEFKTLRQCQAFILFEHMPMIRFFTACDKDCMVMIAALCNAVGC